MSENASMKEKLTARLRKEVGLLSGEHHKERIATIAELYTAIKALEFVEELGGPLESPVAVSSIKVI